MLFFGFYIEYIGYVVGVLLITTAVKSSSSVIVIVVYGFLEGLCNLLAMRSILGGLNSWQPYA